MQNLEDAIEKYRRELLEFSKQNPIHRIENEAVNEDSRDTTIVDEPEYLVDETFDDEPPNQQSQETKLFTSYEEFLEKNTATGLLKVQVFSSGIKQPVTRALVRVTVSLVSEDRELFNGYTDNEGVIDDISLPAPDEKYSLDENSEHQPYSLYNIHVSHPKFAAAEFRNSPVFDSVKSVQPVELVDILQNKNRRLT